MIDAAKFMNSPNGKPPERRSSGRFPIRREVRFQRLGEGPDDAGRGETLNISSRGVLFTTAKPLEKGQWLELFVSWPAQLHGRVALQLVARGPVVRFEKGEVAVSIQQYEFRTQSTPAAHPPGA